MNRDEHWIFCNPADFPLPKEMGMRFRLQGFKYEAVLLDPRVPKGTTYCGKAFDFFVNAFQLHELLPTESAPGSSASSEPDGVTLPVPLQTTTGLSVESGDATPSKSLVQEP